MDSRGVVQDEDEADVPPTSIEEIRAALARSRADLAAGRTVPGEVVLAKLRAMIERHESRRRHGKADG